MGPSMTYLVMWCLFWNYMILMPSSIAPLHLLVQDDWNEMQNDIFSHLTQLALPSASCDANDVFNSTNVFIRSRQRNKMWCSILHSCDSTGASVSVAWCQQCHQLHHYFGRSRSKCNVTWFFVMWHHLWCISTMWWHWHCCWHNVTPLALSSVSNDAIAINIRFTWCQCCHLWYHFIR